MYLPYIILQNSTLKLTTCSNQYIQEMKYVKRYVQKNYEV